MKKTLYLGIFASSLTTLFVSGTVHVQAGTLVMGKMTYIEGGTTSSNKWTGDYTFMVNFDSTTSKITMSQVSGPDSKQNGWNTMFDGTQGADGTVTFDETGVDYFRKPKPPATMGTKYGSGSFKGSFKATDNFFEFDHVTDGSRGGIWKFTTNPTNPTPPPFMQYDDPVLPPFASTPESSSTIGLLALGILGGGATLKHKLKSANSTEKETTKVS